MSNEEIREKILAEAMAELKAKASEVIGGIMSDLYSDYLPHVVGDTDANISYRVEGCLQNMAQGKFEHIGGDLAWVNDSYGYSHSISLTTYQRALKNLCDLMGETITNNRIKQLESDIELLQNQLRDAYRR